ncbi:cytochrome c oxidase subunit 6A1, mitochondrial-like [Nylanderia fulva]|uniref:cytochrome c oxidase subunit 6A1, mitochondrial-like n=1 Tax=Nylanderia fulva TaxID=613905 RepID=UPI0010FB7F57|nr:cytochrome c oxidase subunit 6A1, mitochondrial-like [Nylanderia fulva]XP_029158841.1 cytochrome c oxidase subunit 6A1, mitochondrial-like [Nylanderia fulva]XP_029158842.1 cytochrome c oxidase subunit 6A1, mitochondrial-like [Nylanderia fulva]
MAAWTRAIRTISRKYATSTHEHASSEQTVLLWKRISFFVGFPAIGLAMLNCYLNHQAHHHDEPPEFIAYDHLRIRTKKFPWGDGNHSLFHNPKTNPLPEGYEQ